MSRNQAHHFKPISRHNRRILALEHRLRSIQREWRAVPPTFKKELELNTRNRLNDPGILHLWIKQDGRCAYCCKSLETLRYHVDHIIPKAQDGSNHLTNLALACIHCNITKKDKSVLTFMLKMLSN